jgi:serine-type D-Ala-D-Ala carboxypeptidase (penicillin-binding protein 5/6)
VAVEAGEAISERQALEALLLPSADNMAWILARWDAGGQAGFTAKMNAAARTLGMTGTGYTDPSRDGNDRGSLARLCKQDHQE